MYKYSAGGRGLQGLRPAACGMMSADADDVAYAMMSAAQMMCTAQRCNENTPEAFAFRGVFLLSYRPSCAAAHIIFAKQNIIASAHHAEGTSCRRHIMPKAHHLRSNIIFTLPRPHSPPSGRPARRSSCTGRRIRSRPPARPRTPHAASASGAWRLPGCRSGRCALCHS